MIRTFLLNTFFYIPIWFLKLIFLKKRIPIRGNLFDFQSSVVLSIIPKKDLSIIPDSSIQETRDLINKKRSEYRLSLKAKNTIRRQDHKIDSETNTILREYKPNQIDTDKVILFFHGGGYVLGSIEGHDHMVSYMSENLRTKFYSLEYSLSPENKHPFALGEAINAYEWIISNGYNADKISLCGDSAGAHLAASLVHYLLINGGELPSCQLLIYPMCDPTCSSESYELFYENYLLTKNNMIWFWDKFGNDDSKKNDPTFNLLKIDTNKKFPKTLIVTAGFDPLCDEAEEYAFLLHKNDNNVKQLHYPFMFHGFASMTRLKGAHLAVDDFLKEFRKML